MTVDDIARNLSLFVGTAQKIVHDDLGYFEGQLPVGAKDAYSRAQRPRPSTS